jgi:hypothetical protein
MSESYKIAVPKNSYRRWLASSSQTGKNARKLAFNCLDEIINLMSEAEMKTIELNCLNPVIYPKCKREGTGFLRIQCYCPQCRYWASDKKTVNGTYTITASQNPINPDGDQEKDADFLECIVKYNPHVHERPPQVRPPQVRPPQVRPQAEDNENSISSVNSIDSETSSASSGAADSVGAASSTSSSSGTTSSARSAAATSSTSSAAEAPYHVDGEGFDDPDEDEICKMQLRGKERIDAVVAIVQT